MYYFYQKERDNAKINYSDLCNYNMETILKGCLTEITVIWE